MITFKHQSTYHHESSFSVYDSSDPLDRSYRISWQRPLGSSEEYLRKIANPAMDFDREVIGKVNGVCRDGMEITEEVYDAFCDYLEREHAKDAAAMERIYARFDVPMDERTPLEPLTLPRPIYWDRDTKQWVNPIWFAHYRRPGMEAPTKFVIVGS